MQIRCCRTLATTLIVLAALGPRAAAQSAVALVRHAPTLDGTVEGSIQQMTGEAVTFNGGAVVIGDLLVPGVPTLRLNGNPAFGGTVAGTGASSPADAENSLRSRRLSARPGLVR